MVSYLHAYEIDRAGDRILGPHNSQRSGAPHTIDYQELDNPLTLLILGPHKA